MAWWIQASPRAWGGPGVDSRCRKRFSSPESEIGDPALIINPYNFHYLSLEQSDFDNCFFKLHLNLMKSPNFDGRT